MLHTTSVADGYRYRLNNCVISAESDSTSAEPIAIATRADCRIRVVLFVAIHPIGRYNTMFAAMSLGLMGGEENGTRPTCVQFGVDAKSASGSVTANSAADHTAHARPGCR